MAADGVPSRRISQRVGMHESNVAKWRNRFRDKGLEGLEGRPRPGGPKRFGHDERMKVAAAATSERDPDDPVSTWTYSDLAQKLWAEGVEISVSQLWRIDRLEAELAKTKLALEITAKAHALLEMLSESADSETKPKP